MASLLEQLSNKAFDDAPKAKAANMSAKMLASFVDGTKTMVEMTAIGNALGFAPEVTGAYGPHCNVADLPNDPRFSSYSAHRLGDYRGSLAAPLMRGGSVLGVIGLVLLVFGTIYGAVHWIASASAGVATAPGTVMLAALPVLVGVLIGGCSFPGLRRRSE